MDKDFEALIKHLSQDKMEELLKKYALEDENLREEILSKSVLTIVDAALAANPQTRLCIAAIALETIIPARSQ